MKLAYLVAMMIGAVIGFIIGVELKMHLVRELAPMADGFTVLSIALRSGPAAAGAGALIAAGSVYVLRMIRAR